MKGKQMGNKKFNNQASKPQNKIKKHANSKKNANGGQKVVSKDINDGKIKKINKVEE